MESQTNEDSAYRGGLPGKSGVGGGEGHTGPVRFKRTAHTQTRAVRTTTKYDPQMDRVLGPYLQRIDLFRRDADEGAVKLGPMGRLRRPKPSGKQGGWGKNAAVRRNGRAPMRTRNAKCPRRDPGRFADLSFERERIEAWSAHLIASGRRSRSLL